jgi:hypothetical protein
VTVGKQGRDASWQRGRISTALGDTGYCSPVKLQIENDEPRVGVKENTSENEAHQVRAGTGRGQEEEVSCRTGDGLNQS